MNEIKIYLKPSGSIAELYKDFNLYQGSYQNVKLSLYVPKSLLYQNEQTTFGNAIKTGAILTAPNGKKVTTESYYADYVKDEVAGDVEYSVYSQKLPKEYVVYTGTQTIVANVVSIDTTDENNPVILEVTTSQTAKLVVLESAYLSKEEIIEPDAATVINAKITALQEGKQNKLTAGKNINISEDYVISAIGEISLDWGSLVGDINNQTDLKNKLDAKADTNGEYPDLTAGHAIDAENDGTGNNIAEQFATVSSDIDGLREDITNESHFRGMFDSVEALRAAYPTATPNDYAYIVGGNQWIYQNGAWTDSEKPTPNTAVPRGTSIPLMDGVGSAGTSSAYASEDHRHPSDTNKVNKSGDTMTGALNAPSVKVNNQEVYSPSNPQQVYDFDVKRTNHRSMSGGIPPVYNAMPCAVRANMLAFTPANGIKLEYSTNGGSTWTAQSDVTDVRAVMTRNGVVKCCLGSTCTNQDQMRITLIGAASGGYGYYNFKSFYIYGTFFYLQNFFLKIEELNAQSQWVVRQDNIMLQGYPEDNWINEAVAFGGNNDWSSKKLRFTFYNTFTTPQVVPELNRFYGYGINYTQDTVFASFDHLYDWDVNQNAYFPTKVYVGSNKTQVWSNNNRPTAEGYSTSSAVTRAGQTDTVISYYRSSAGYTWYRVWASGWKECGGQVDVPSSAGNTTITFPRQFQVAPTSLSICRHTSGTANAIVSDIAAINITSKEFVVRNYNGPVHWYACGY